MLRSIWSKVRIKSLGHGETFSEWKLDWLCTFIKEGDLFNFKPKPDWLLWPSAIKTIARDYNSWIWVTFMGDPGKIGGVLAKQERKVWSASLYWCTAPRLPTVIFAYKKPQAVKILCTILHHIWVHILGILPKFVFLFTQLYNAAEKVHVQYAPTNYHPAHIFSAL